MFMWLCETQVKAKAVGCSLPHVHDVGGSGG